VRQGLSLLFCDALMNEPSDLFIRDIKDGLAMFGPWASNGGRPSHYRCFSVSVTGASLRSNLERGLSLAWSSVGE